MASRSLTDLHPVVQDKCRRVIEACRARGVTLLVTCTLRSNKEQAGLYARGRTKPGPRVTNAKPGSSAHNYGLAMDVVPLRDGKAIWDAKAHEWQVYGEEVRRVGLEWAGDWTRFREFPHCQAPNWRQHV